MLKQTLIFLFIILGVSANAQLYTFKNYSHRDGIVTEATLCSEVGPKGYLWVGTDGGGIMRFDGKRFLEVQTGGNPTFHVSDIVPEEEETVYFSTLYDGVYRFKNNKYSFVYQPHLMVIVEDYVTQTLRWCSLQIVRL